MVYLVEIEHAKNISNFVEHIMLPEIIHDIMIRVIVTYPNGEIIQYFCSDNKQTLYLVPGCKFIIKCLISINISDKILNSQNKTPAKHIIDNNLFFQCTCTISNKKTSDVKTCKVNEWLTFEGWESIQDEKIVTHDFIVKKIDEKFNTNTNSLSIDTSADIHIDFKLRHLIFLFPDAIDLNEKAYNKMIFKKKENSYNSNEEISINNDEYEKDGYGIYVSEDKEKSPKRIKMDKPTFVWRPKVFARDITSHDAYIKIKNKTSGISK